MDKLRYSEIFYSVQGEGRFVVTSTAMVLDRTGTKQNGWLQKKCHT
jgi:hypothetical protein